MYILIILFAATAILLVDFFLVIRRRYNAQKIQALLDAGWEMRETAEYSPGMVSKYESFFRAPNSDEWLPFPIAHKINYKQMIASGNSKMFHKYHSF